MPITIAQLIKPFEDKPELAERIAFRKVPQPIAIVPPNPDWPLRFQAVKQRIQTALGSSSPSSSSSSSIILTIAHTGSTSIPGLPAKDTIDVDLSLRDVLDEASYVAPLEQAGFRFLLREPHWHGHRFFVEDWDCPGAFGFAVNLHVFGPDCPEVVRHRVFREWLLKCPADLELYADVKRRAAERTREVGGLVVDYNRLKEDTILEILGRAFGDLGYLDRDPEEVI